jgi:CheY-like chemotaxis protein
MNTATILVVDDEEDILHLLSTVLGDIGGYTVLRARDGHEALRLAEANKPDAILLDVKLPGIDGYDVCRAVKANPALAATRVLFLSGLPQDSENHRALAAGADAYVMKPFSPAALVKEVGRVLTLRPDQLGPA